MTGKLHNRLDLEDRALDYRLWRWSLGCGAVADIDHIEFRDGEPVALLELTRWDPLYGFYVSPPPSYFDAITQRFGEQAQGEIARVIAAKLGVSAWIVLFRADLLDFWLYDWSHPAGWSHVDRDGYERWLRSL